MLTKDLIKYRLRKNKITPSFINTSDGDLLLLAESLISLYKKSIGLIRVQLDKEISEIIAKHPLIPAFQKLLEDACTFDEDEDFEATRWEWLQKAQNLRQEMLESRDHFRVRLSQEVGKEFDDVKNLLYRDLPENRKLVEFKLMTSQALLHRYNCAQVQGLILHTGKINLRLCGTGLSERRNLFRMIKFHRLLVHVTAQTEQELCCEISGPLTIFDNAQSYGLRMATFFPYVLQCPKWQLTADVKVDKREGTLSLDETVGIKSHYKVTLGHIPEEFSVFCETFNCMDLGVRKGWQGISGDGFLHLGQQSYCFPDFKFIHTSGAVTYLELFHRWHHGQILQRLDALEKNQMKELVIGVCRSLRNNDAILKIVDEVTMRGLKVFWFRDFPTPKQVVTQLD